MSRLMRVIIPAAGSGQRFVDAGLTTPKPLIQVGGQPMIKHVLDLAKLIDPAPIVVCHYSIASELRRLGCLTQTIIHKQNGPALTLLAANGQLADDEPVMIMDCDNIIGRSAFKRYISFLQQAELFDSTLLTTPWENDMGLAWSFVRCHPRSGRVVEVAERRRVGEHVTCGVHTFRHWEILRNAILHSVVAREDVYKNEHYVAPLHMQVKVTGYFDIPNSAFRSVGTPEQLIAYEQTLQEARNG